jgi:hypothetical protein
MCFFNLFFSQFITNVKHKNRRHLFAYCGSIPLIHFQGLILQASLPLLVRLFILIYQIVRNNETSEFDQYIDWAITGLPNLLYPIISIYFIAPLKHVALKLFSAFFEIIDQGSNDNNVRPASNFASPNDKIIPDDNSSYHS